MKAYKCPAGIWTIGYGHTAGVSAGMQISEAQAEKYLVEDLQYFEHEVRKLITVHLKQQEFDAIVSFTYNVGSGNLSSSTFRRRINGGDNKARCFCEEFPKWVNGSDGPLPGLVRRRDAEVELATS